MTTNNTYGVQRNGLPRKTGLSRSQVNLSEAGFDRFTTFDIDLRNHASSDLRNHAASNHQNGLSNPLTGQFSGTSSRQINGYGPHNGYESHRLTFHETYNHVSQSRPSNHQRIPYSEKALSNSALNNLKLGVPKTSRDFFDMHKVVPVEFRKASELSAKYPYRKDYAGAPAQSSQPSRDCSCGGSQTPSYRSSVSSEESSPLSLSSRNGLNRAVPTYQMSSTESPPEYPGYRLTSDHTKVLPEPFYWKQPPPSVVPMRTDQYSRNNEPSPNSWQYSVVDRSTPPHPQPYPFSSSQSRSPSARPTTNSSPNPQTFQAVSSAVTLSPIKSMEVPKPTLQHAVAPEQHPKIFKGGGTNQTPVMIGRLSQQSQYHSPSPTARDYFAHEPVGVLATGRCEPVLSAKVRNGNGQLMASPVNFISSPIEASTTTAEVMGEKDAANESDVTGDNSSFIRTFVNPYHNCSPDAYKFYIEQHMDAIKRVHESRRRRRMELEQDLSQSDFSEPLKDDIRRTLCQKETNYMRQTRVKLDRTNFEKIRTIGIGAFGEVALVQKKDTELIYAMKTLKKSHILEKKQIGHVMAERDILAKAENEWVVKLFFSFQDPENLYFVMEYVPGGDLMNLLVNKGQFDEPLARFYIAELVEAIGSVHAIGFIHRDIKPDNILIDKNGHLKLTDFGLCTGFHWTHNAQNYNFGEKKSWDRETGSIHVRTDSLAWQNRDVVETVENAADRVKREPRKGPVFRRSSTAAARQYAHSQVGTPNYMAPEVLKSSDNAGYTQVCDWWSVGVILYEMLCGRPPFFAPTPQETQLKVVDWRHHLRLPNYPLSSESADLITRLCCDAEDRLGNCRSEYTPPNDFFHPRSTRDIGAEEIKNHPFFREIDWSKNLRKQTSPYIPTILHPWDTTNFDNFDDSASPSDMWSDAGNAPLDSGTNSAREQSFFHFTYRRFFDSTGDVDKEVYQTPIQTPTQGSCYGGGLERNGGNGYSGQSIMKSPEYREPPSYNAAVSPLGPGPLGEGRGVGSPGNVLKNAKTRDDKPVYV